MVHRDQTDTESPGNKKATSAALRNMARRMAVARRLMGEVLPVDLLHDPALDILLALYQADHPIAANNLAFYTTVSANVAARWLIVLDSRKLVEVVENRIVLSGNGTDHMNTMLSIVMERQREL